MHQLMTGEEESFDKIFYEQLVECIEQYDDKLVDVVNSQWMGFRKYANNGGNPGVDDWIGCDTYTVQNIVTYIEKIHIFTEKLVQIEQSQDAFKF